MKLDRLEKLAERVAMILLECGTEEDLGIVSSEGRDLATRALRARVDPSWGTLVGSPHYTKRLSRVVEWDGDRG